MTDYVYRENTKGEPVRVPVEKVEKDPEGFFDKELMSRPEAERLQGQIDAQRMAEETYGTVGSAAMQAADTAGLGLPGWMAIKGAELSGDDSRANKIRRALEGTSLTGAGQVGAAAGFIAPLLAGPETLLGRGTAVGGLGRIGTLGERLAERVLPETPGLMGSAAKSVLKMASRGMSEGAVIGLTNQMSQSAIQDVPLTVGSLAAGMGEGALYGGLATGGLGAIGRATEAVLGAGERAVIGRVAGSGARAEMRVADRLGLDKAMVGDIASKEGQVKPFLTRAHEGLEEQGLSLKSSTSDIAKGSKVAAEQYQKVRAGIMETVERGASNDVTDVVSRIKNSARDEISLPYKGTPYYAPAQRAIDNITSTLEHTDKQVGATWSSLMKTRDMLAEQYDSIVSKAGQDAPRVMGSQDVFRKLIGIIDSEIKAGIAGVEEKLGAKGLAEQYTAATLQKTTMTELANAASKKAIAEVAHPRAAIQPFDLGTMAMGALTGHPLGGAAIVASRVVGRRIGDYIGPQMAEMAYRNMTSAKAAAQTELVKGRIRDSVSRFFGVGAKGATVAAIKSTKRKPAPISRDKYEAELERTRDLISDMHAARVEAYARQQAQEVHPDMYKAIVDQYQRARDYVQYNLPAGSHAKQVQSLGKMPKAHGLNLKELKSERINGGIKNPLAVLDDMENGSVSRDQVLAMKAVYPEIHSQIVQESAFKIAEMKEQGKYLPADKIATLGIVLDSPIDSTLTPEFIGAVQASFIPPPKPDQAPPPPDQGMTQALMTPLDKSLT